MIRRIYAFLILLLVLSSCGINSNLMFKSKDGTEIITENIPIAPTDAYRMAPDDKFVFTLYANDGKRIVDLMSGVSEDGVVQRSSGAAVLNYWIQPSGYADLPVIGQVKMAGLSVKEGQDTLAKRFSRHYNDPFVQIEVTNQRVIVFPGGGGDAKIIPLLNNNTTLMEALASAGGIAERGKARKIKVMRLTDNGRKVYEIDLSKIEGLKYADMVVQANDYIYVEPTRQLSREIIRELTPILSVLSSVIIIITILK